MPSAQPALLSCNKTTRRAKTGRVWGKKKAQPLNDAGGLALAWQGDGERKDLGEIIKLGLTFSFPAARAPICISVDQTGVTAPTPRQHPNQALWSPAPKTPPFHPQPGLPSHPAPQSDSRDSR